MSESNREPAIEDARHALAVAEQVIRTIRRAVNPDAS